MTGAHFTPAQAVIEELKKYPDVEIIYVGRKTTLEGDTTSSVESQILPRLGVKFIPIITGRLQLVLTIYTFSSLLKIPWGLLQALGIILKERPDVTLSFGGYVALPLVFMSWLFSIPVILHEQTLVSGLANRISAVFADKIAISFAENKSFQGSKVVLTGNPIRREILFAKRTVQNKIPLLLITGGNQGSHVINLAVEACLDDLKKICQVIHQTGDSKFKDFERLKNQENTNYQVYKWIDNMGKAVADADLVISRAGMNTLSELMFLQKPALLVPFPHLYQDEQNKNAQFLAKLGMVQILPQNKLTGHLLLKNIKEMLKNLKHYQQAAKKASSLIIPGAGRRVTLEVYTLAKG